MSSVRTVLLVVVAAGLGVSCGGGDRLTTPARVESHDVTPLVTTAASDAAPHAAAGPRWATLARTVELDQPVVWPAPDVVFGTPQEAAADFVTNVVSDAAEVTLGEYQGGDSLSGEIEVLYLGDDGEGAGARSVLSMRRVFPSGGWYVIAAVSDDTSITAPACCPAASVAPGLLTVEGMARGHEATVVVSAFPAGDGDSLIDRVIAAGGLYELAPYSATLDLTAALPGSHVILVRTDAALTNDPGQLSAIPITVGLPGTR